MRVWSMFPSSALELLVQSSIEVLTRRLSTLLASAGHDERKAVARLQFDFLYLGRVENRTEVELSIRWVVL
jgi:hypothetical protein